MDLEAIRLRVRHEVDRYVYEVPDGAVGTQWSDSKVQAYLQEMRDSLISPYVATITMYQPLHLDRSDAYEERECAVVADPNDGYLLFYDPVEDQFGIAQKRDDKLFDICLPGDAVGSFMAR